jgi:AraC-like DNA-binding protein
MALTESHAKRAGGEGVLARVSELMFIEAVRRHVESLPADQIGWLAGLRDRFVGRALNLLHGRPGFAWTLEQLAREVGLSRSALAERFAHFVGQPPIQYLAHWRMQVATAMLANGSDNVAQVAFAVGYESEAAFSRAFKRVLGAPPASWRKAQA